MGRVLTVSNMNPYMVKLQYAVRGPLVLHMHEIDKQMRQGKKMPFPKIIKAQLGDAHHMGQKPITFFRQMVGAAVYPELLKSSKIPEDVKDRINDLLVQFGGSMGTYTNSLGLESIRKTVAKYLERRDKHPVDYDDVVLTTGATTGIKTVLQLFTTGPGEKPSGVMTPTPQYPAYSAAIDEYGLYRVPYMLDEDHNWALDPNDLQRAIDAAASEAKVRALVVINPGNPTGQVLKRKNIEALIKFAYDHKLYIFADEVYQMNVWEEDAKFYSFKRVLMDLGEPYSKSVEMASFMSMSKGYMGECGLRGGWMELTNLDPGVKKHLHKCFGALLSPNTIGQVVVDCVCNPPKKGDPSYDLHEREKEDILSSLKERAHFIQGALNDIPGMSCQKVQGAMYAFPRLNLSQKAIDAAKKANQAPDLYYCWHLLETTGICVLPGSGFGQRAGSHHFRTTILPGMNALKEMMSIFKKFHINFTEKYV